MPAIRYGKCQVIAQATLAGVQDVRVASGVGVGPIYG
jgi:hypothetical protein